MWLLLQHVLNKSLCLILVNAVTTWKMKMSTVLKLRKHCLLEFIFVAIAITAHVAILYVEN